MRQNFLDFFDAEYHLVVRFLMRAGASLSEAEDAVQHMSVQAWRKVQEKAWDEIGFPRVWARTVALHHYLAQRRGRVEVPLGTDVDAPAPGEGHAELTGQARDVIALLQVLGPDCRTWPSATSLPPSQDWQDRRQRRAPGMQLGL
jgi:DNA-directed RNA polymerase specialized sigma24 family protein